jgi:hypothetical protein
MDIYVHENYDSIYHGQRSILKNQLFCLDTLIVRKVCVLFLPWNMKTYFCVCVVKNLFVLSTKYPCFQEYLLEICVLIFILGQRQGTWQMTEALLTHWLVQPVAHPIEMSVQTSATMAGRMSKYSEENLSHVHCESDIDCTTPSHWSYKMA